MSGFNIGCRVRRIWGLGIAVGLAVTLTPLAAHADGMLDPGVVHSWIDTVNASQEAQPHWMTPIITTTPRLEQELRWDFYDQQNGKPPQGNGQRLLNDGGPGGPRVEFIPQYNTQITLAAPPVISASGPRGTQTSPGDWPVFLAKYRLMSANEEHGNYIVTAFFQMSVPSGYGFLAGSRGQLHVLSERTARGLEPSFADPGANFGPLRARPSKQPHHWGWLSVCCNKQPCGPERLCGHGETHFLSTLPSLKQKAPTRCPGSV